MHSPRCWPVQHPKKAPPRRRRSRWATWPSKRQARDFGVLLRQDLAHRLHRPPLRRGRSLRAGVLSGICWVNCCRFFVLRTHSIFLIWALDKTVWVVELRSIRRYQSSHKTAVLLRKCAFLIGCPCSPPTPDFRIQISDRAARGLCRNAGHVKMRSAATFHHSAPSMD